MSDGLLLADAYAKVLRKHGPDRASPVWACICGVALPASAPADEAFHDRLDRHIAEALDGVTVAALARVWADGYDAGWNDPWWGTTTNPHRPAHAAAS